MDMGGWTSVSLLEWGLVAAALGCGRWQAPHDDKRPTSYRAMVVSAPVVTEHETQFVRHALVGFGGLLALILLWDVTSAPWACQPHNGELPLPNVNYYTCVDTIAGTLTTYHVLAFGFGLIALAGLAWPLLYHIWRRGHRVTE
jgi:hypothetical protein